MLACLQRPLLFGLSCSNLRDYRVGMCVDVLLVQTCHVEQYNDGQTPSSSFVLLAQLYLIESACYLTHPAASPYASMNTGAHGICDLIACNRYVVYLLS